mmetsp:Transcript_33840/g.89846  ORF Transcript_33840/g.89846 Transcript_33840/m.89846 type:complete len:195 (-) Transcript_33840:100-684(-)
MSRQAAEWAAYLDLPTVRGSAGGPGGPRVPAHLLEDFSEDAYRCEAIDLAYQVCSEHMRWADSQEVQEKERRERQDAIRAAKAGARGGGGYPVAATASKPAVASGGRDEVTIEFHLPPSGTPPRTEAFKPWIQSFDIYGRVYEMLPSKDRAFFMTVKGPGVQGIKKLDESTWDSRLSDLGMRAGSAYTLHVTQA